MTRRSSSAAASSAARRAATAASSAVRCASTSVAICCSSARTPLGVGLDLVGVAALLAHLLARRSGVADALGGQALGAAEPLAQRPERVLHLLGGGERRQVLAERGLDGRLGLPRLRQLGLHLLAALHQHRLVGDLLVEGGARGDEVVGQEPRPGVAGVGLHPGRLARHLRLASERLELAADLGEAGPGAG